MIEGNYHPDKPYAGAAGAAVVLFLLTVLLAFSGHPVWTVMLGLATFGALAVVWEARSYNQLTTAQRERGAAAEAKARKEADERRAQTARETEARRAESSKHQIAQQRSKLRGPPVGAIPPHPDALFVLLTERRWTGLPRTVASIELTCGRCAYEWAMPRTTVEHYRTETGPGSGMAAFNNPRQQSIRQSAIAALRCPSCGSIEPGIWVAP